MADDMQALPVALMGEPRFEMLTESVPVFLSEAVGRNSQIALVMTLSPQWAGLNVVLQS